MKMFRKDEGFTLVELMVVVLIIGILVAIAIPVFNAAKANAQKKSCFANQRTIEGAAQTYAADNDGTLPASPAALTPTYIKVAPFCPADASKAAYSFGTSGTVAACGYGDPVHGHF
ncbi:MAG: prepilin-type N-terminal cleavage/methylation domain-containing protein [Coriobacteriia bacterium]|nr:prepilin-type N-terminal cleavage/methylation domain-containing protein [Coriobacteriia bacterium]